MALAAQEGIELSDELLDGIAGGRTMTAQEKSELKASVQRFKESGRYSMEDTLWCYRNYDSEVQDEVNGLIRLYWDIV